MSKGKVTEQEAWVMKGMHSDGISIKEISKRLSRSQSTVKKYLDIKEQEQEEPVKEHKGPSMVTLQSIVDPVGKRVPLRGRMELGPAERLRQGEVARRLDL